MTLIGRGLLALVLVAWALLAFSPAAKAGVLTLLLVPELLNLGGPRPIVLVSGAPTVAELRFARAEADMYLPAGPGPHGGLVLTLGVHPLGKREPVVARLAEGLARAGLAVMLVQSDDLIADRILPSEPGNLVTAFELLREQPRIAEDRIGLLGFSAGASLGFLAAADPAIADETRVVAWVGGFADAMRMVEEVASDSYLDDGRRVAWEPDELTRFVFRKQLVDVLPDPDEREVLAAAYLHDYDRSDPSVRPDPDGLSPDARAVLRLFEASSPDEVERAAAALPHEIKLRLASLSPINAVDRFQSRAILLVDPGDSLVPYVHTRDMARALPPEHLVRYVEFEIFEHVRPTRPAAPVAIVRDLARLGGSVALLLLELDPANR